MKKYKSKLGKQSEASNKMYAIYEEITQYMSHKQLCEELVRTMSDKEAYENFEHIIRMWNLPFRIDRRGNIDYSEE